LSQPITSQNVAADTIGQTSTQPIVPQDVTTDVGVSTQMPTTMPAALNFDEILLKKVRSAFLPSHESN